MAKQTNPIDDKLNKLQDFVSRNVKHKFKYTEEKWFTSEQDNVCPMCKELQDLGWIPSGILPRYKQAHSTLGDGNWKAPDSSCNCRKGYRQAAGSKPEWAKDGKLEWDPGSEQYLIFKASVKQKVQLIQQKYNFKCTC